MTKSPYRVFAMSMLLVTACATTLAEEIEHTDPKRGFSFLLPDEWMAVDAAAIAQTQAQAESLMADINFTYIAGYSPVSAEELVYPYILVQETKGSLSTLTWDELETAFGAINLGQELRERSDLGTIVSDMEIGQMLIDRDLGRTMIRMSMTLPEIGEVKGLIIGFLGRDGVIQLNFYDRAEQFDTHIDQFLWMADTFRFDEGRSFVPASGIKSRLPWLDVGEVMWSAIIGGISVAIGMAIFLAWKRRRG